MIITCIKYVYFHIVEWKQELLAHRESIKGLDYMSVEFEQVVGKNKSKSWVSLSRWFSRQKTVAATSDDVKAEWSGTSFKVYNTFIIRYKRDMQLTYIIIFFLDSTRIAILAPSGSFLAGFAQNYPEICWRRSRRR
jgi:hypothetical protein